MARCRHQVMRPAGKAVAGEKVLHRLGKVDDPVRNVQVCERGHIADLRFVHEVDELSPGIVDDGREREVAF